jgi:hypothetical protein
MKAKLISRALVAVSLCVGSIVHAQDPLPSRNDTSPRSAIIAFVERVTKEGSPDFVKPEERIATFDNDGTLWVSSALSVVVSLRFGRHRLGVCWHRLVAGGDSPCGHGRLMCRVPAAQSPECDGLIRL